MTYKRILLKLSGEALMGEQQYGIDPARLQEYAEDIKEIVNIQIDHLANRLEERNISLELTDSAKEVVAYCICCRCCTRNLHSKC